jgi:hypothetical protein
MPMILLSLLKQFWLPLVLIAVVFSALGALKYYGHTEYKRGYADADRGRITCETSFKIEQANWVAQVQQQQTELATLAKKKQEVITKQVVVYRDRIKEVEVAKKETDNEIKATITPNDVVIVPAAFTSVYNHAVEGSNLATGDSTVKDVSRYSTGVIGKTQIFDAVAFTEVVKGNVDAYNELAVRFNKLVDVVQEIEKLNER